MATGTMSRTVLPAITEERVQPARTRWRWLRRLLLGAGFVAAVAVVREVYFQPPLIPVTITHPDRVDGRDKSDWSEYRQFD
jgi:hypothetical protein